MADQDQEDMNLEGEDEAPAPAGKELVEIQLSDKARWNKFQAAAQHQVELEENKKKASALTSRNKQLQKLIAECLKAGREGREMVDKDQVQTAMELGGEDGQAAAKGLIEMADRAAADYSAGSGVVETPEEVDA